METIFARIENARLRMLDQQVHLVLLVTLLSASFQDQPERFDLPLNTLRQLMLFTGAVEAEDLAGKIVRVMVDVDGEVLNLGAATDGKWLLNPIRYTEITTMGD